MQGKLHWYQLTRELAKKYSHTSYLAWRSQEPERQVMLTIWAASFFRLPHEREEWLLNAERIQQMQHSHLLPLLEVGIDEGQPFLAREYLPHDSLRNHLRKISPHRLELQKALTILLEVGQALTYAHERNIIHGNIKPENILFDANGHALLTDFPPVRRRDVLIRDQATEEYAFCYQAPEQFSGICNAGSLLLKCW